jgi:hypothetical protein
MDQETLKTTSLANNQQEQILEDPAYTDMFTAVREDQGYSKVIK